MDDFETHEPMEEGMWAWEVVVGVGVVGEEAAASVESVGLVWSSWRGVILTEVGGSTEQGSFKM